MIKGELQIAVVDDDASFLRAQERLLRAAGFVPRTYPSGEAFLMETPRPPVDCLIVDIRLGTMTGFELAKRLAAEKWPVPVIFMTAHDSAETRERAQQAGGVGYLRKPFPAEALFEAIREAIPSSPVVAEAALAAWAAAKGVQELGASAPQKPEP